MSIPEMVDKPFPLEVPSPSSEDDAQLNSTESVPPRSPAGAVMRDRAMSVIFDQSFMRDITVDGDDVGIITAVVAMAKSLALEVVAEGVDTRE